MKTGSLESVLRGHPFLTDLEPLLLQELVSCATNLRFHAGEYLAREGEQADTFYLLRSGKVALQVHAPDRAPILLDTLGEGDIVGWSWLVAPYRWRSDTKAVEGGLAICLDGRCLRKKCEEDHELGYQLLKRFASIIERRLESARLQLVDVYGVPR